MESVILEKGDVDIEGITKAVLSIADWLLAHKSEIKALIKKGWTSATKIYRYLKEKYHK